ncbi:MAG: hypothetical protein ACKO0Z_18255 [Betaproteobacteria bacterium]
MYVRKLGRQLALLVQFTGEDFNPNTAATRDAISLINLDSAMDTRRDAGRGGWDWRECATIGAPDAWTESCMDTI